MADSQDTPSLPENRADLELLIETAIARLDEIDGEADLEPSLGSHFSHAHVGTVWPDTRTDYTIAKGLDECEDVSEDEGAACEDEGAVEVDCDPHSEDDVSFFHYRGPDSRQRDADACRGAVDQLRAVIARKRQMPDGAAPGSAK